jgi:DNA-binding NarL/FixJ family response regulator
MVTKSLITPAELTVMHGLCMGLTARKIASVMFVSEHSVRNHAYVTRQKLGVHTNCQAVLLLIKKGWIDLNHRCFSNF